MTDRDILLDLVRGTRCACTAAKKPRMSLCRGCYGRLPVGLQRALYERDEYPAAYRRALTFLGFPEPANAAPDRGPQAGATPDLFQTHK